MFKHNTLTESEVQKATQAGNGPEGLQALPVAVPSKDGDILDNTAVQRLPTLSEPHRVRVVKLKPYKSIQVIRSHSCKEKRGVGLESIAGAWCPGSRKRTRARTAFCEVAMGYLVGLGGSFPGR